MIEDNQIYVGVKPFMNYVTGVVMQFTTKGASEVVVKARGKFISRAVDVSEVAAKRFLQGSVEVKNIDINSEEFTNNEGKKIRVSTIEITLVKIEWFSIFKGDKMIKLFDRVNEKIVSGDSAATFESIDSALLLREESKDSFVVEFLDNQDFSNILYTSDCALEAKRMYDFFKEEITSYLHSTPNASSRCVLYEFQKPHKKECTELQRA